MVNLTEKHIDTIREALHAYLSDAYEGGKFGDYDDDELAAIEANVESVEDALAPSTNYFERCDKCGRPHIWFGKASQRPDCDGKGSNGYDQNLESS